MRYPFILIAAILLSACQTEIRQANRRGMDHLRHKEYQEAVNEFDRVLELDNRWYPAYYNRAVSFANSGRYREALKDFDYVLANYPCHAKAFFNRAVVNENMGRFSQAIRDYSEAIRLQPDFIMAYHYRGIARFRMDDLNGALGDYDKALLLGRNVSMDVHSARAYGLNSSALHFNRAVLLQKIRKHEEAVKAYTSSIEIDPANARAYYNRAISEMALKRKKEALKDLEIASNLGFSQADTVKGHYFPQ